jgi:hypothetical protein
MRVQIQSLSHHIPGPFKSIELLYGFRILLVDSINTYYFTVLHLLLRNAMAAFCRIPSIRDQAKAVVRISLHNSLLGSLGER